MNRIILALFISSIFGICKGQQEINPRFDLNNAINLNQKFGFDAKLIGNDGKLDFFPWHKYKVYNGYINTTDYTNQYTEIRRTSEVLRFTLPHENINSNSVNMFLSYFILHEEGQSYGSYITLLKLDYDSYSHLYIDKNLDQDFTNDGEPMLLPFEDSEITVALKFLNYNIETNLIIPNVQSESNTYKADTLFIKQTQIPHEQRFRSFLLWNDLVNRKDHFFAGFFSGAGGGGSQKITYSSISDLNSDYIIEGFSFTRIGLGLQAGFELHNIVLGINYGFEFWRTSDYFRELKEGHVIDKFGAVRDNKAAIPAGYSYYGGSLGYNINISHKFLLQPLMTIGSYNYIGNVSERYNSLQKNRKYQSASFTAFVPLSPKFLVSAGLTFIKYSFDQPKNISAIIISSEQDLVLTNIKMSAVSFQFGTTFRL